MKNIDIEKISVYALVALAAAHVALFTVEVYHCIGYPYDLDWIEGVIFAEVARVSSGKPLYAAPSLEFTASMYPPLYVYVSALASHVMGLKLVTLRLVSLGATLGVFAVVYSFAWRETRKHWPAAVSCAVFAAGFHYSSGQLNMARIDHLFLFLIVSSAYLLRFHGTARGLAASGALVFLAFLAKQTALFVFVPLAAYSVLYDKRKAAYFIVPAAGLSVLGDYALNLKYHGWYNYYVFGIPSKHGVISSMITGFWTSDMLPFIVVTAVSLYFVYSAFSSGDRKGAMFYAMLFCGMIGGAWVSRVNEGSSWNVLLPAFACLAPMFAAGVDRLMLDAGYVRRVAVVLLCGAQLALLLYNPMERIPSSGDMEAGKDFVARLRDMDGEVYMPFTSYLASYAGKKPFANNMAVDDVLEHDSGEAGKRLLDELKSSIRDKRFEAVIVYPGVLYPELETELMRNYVVSYAWSRPGAKYWANGTAIPAMYVLVRE